MKKEKKRIIVFTTYMDRRPARGTAVFIREFVNELLKKHDKFHVTLAHHELIPKDDVYERSLNYGWQAFKAVMSAFPNWRAIQQDHGQASYYSKADFPSLGERSSFTRPNI